MQPEVKKELEMRSTFKILFYANKGKEKDGIVPVIGVFSWLLQRWMQSSEEMRIKRSKLKHIFDTNNPIYDPAEEEFRRRMQKKKKRGPRL